MLTLDSTTTIKLAALRALPGHHVFEIVKIDWPAPTGTKYYGFTEVHKISPACPVSPVEARLTPGNSDGAQLFLQINQQSAMSDEDVDLQFADLEGDLADLAFEHGEGVKVEIFYWFPQVALLYSEWIAHLKRPKSSDGETINLPASNGFRSPLLPLPNRPSGDTDCSAIYGGLLQTLEEVAENSCDYNRHLGGDIGKLEGGLPIPTCTRKDRIECQRHFELDEGPLPFLGMESTFTPFAIPQIHTPTINAVSIGNESNLKEPIPVIFGARWVRDRAPLAYRPEPNASHPDQGFVAVQVVVCEGPIENLSQLQINGSLIGFIHQVIRRGTHRQTDSGYTTSGPTTPNFSESALFFARYGQVNPAGYNAGNLKGTCFVEGLNNIRIYTDDETYTESFTQNRAWCLLEIFRNTRWGHGTDLARLVIQDWIDAAAWSARSVSFIDLNGETRFTVRSSFACELNGRTTQQQINDICLAGRFGLPFSFQGKTRIVPLRAATEEELDASPLFCDGSIGGTEGLRNIVVDSRGKSSLKAAQKSDDELPNQILLTFEDAAHGNVQRPLTFRDQQQQLRAGHAGGDRTRRIVEKKYGALGVVNENEAIRLGTLLLDLGEFDSGGLANNLKITFTGWFADTLDLHRYKVIRVLSSKITRYGFEYFRIMDLERQPDLKVEVTAQAYPAAYYDAFESETVPGGVDPPGDGYEAEDEGNTLAGGASVHADAECSGGFKVIDLGSCRFNGITRTFGGRYIMFLDYKATEATALTVQVNSTSPTTLALPATDGVRRIMLIRGLSPGTNSIMFAASGAAEPPELDRLIVDFDPIILPGGGTCRPEFGTITYEDGRLTVPIMPC